MIENYYTEINYKIKNHIINAMAKLHFHARNKLELEFLDTSFTDIFTNLRKLFARKIV